MPPSRTHPPPAAACPHLHGQLADWREHKDVRRRNPLVPAKKTWVRVPGMSCGSAELQTAWAGRPAQTSGRCLWTVCAGQVLGPLQPSVHGLVPQSPAPHLAERKCSSSSGCSCLAPRPAEHQAGTLATHTQRGQPLRRTPVGPQASVTAPQACQPHLLIHCRDSPVEQALKHWQREGCRLSAARDGAAADVAPRQGQRDAGGLDGRWVGVAQRLAGLEQRP